MFLHAFIGPRISDVLPGFVEVLGGFSSILAVLGVFSRGLSRI